MINIRGNPSFRNKSFNSISLDFANITFLSCFFLFFLMINLYFLILAVIGQIFYPTPELAKPTGKTTNEANAEI